jgi:hypothetical protein
VGLARACGVDFARLAYDYVNYGEEGTRYPGRYDTGVCWINPWTDTTYAAKALLQGHLGLRTYLDSLVTGKKVSAVFEKGDVRPGFAYLLNMISYLKKR